MRGNDRITGGTQPRPVGRRRLQLHGRRDDDAPVERGRGGRPTRTRAAAGRQRPFGAPAPFHRAGALLTGRLGAEHGRLRGDQTGQEQHAYAAERPTQHGGGVIRSCANTSSGATAVAIRDFAAGTGSDAGDAPPRKVAMASAHCLLSATSMSEMPHSADRPGRSPAFRGLTASRESAPGLPCLDSAGHVGPSVNLLEDFTCLTVVRSSRP